MTFQPKAILADLDGVIRHFPEKRDREIESHYQIAVGGLARAAFEPNDLFRVTTGKISDDVWRNEIVKRLKSELQGLDVAAAFEEWSNFSGHIDTATFLYLRSIAHSLPFALLTNATDRLTKDLSDLGIHDAFTHIFNSCEIGFVKPSKEIYRFAVDALQLDPGSIIFIDDSTDNVASARDFGFKAFHYSTLDQLRNQIDGTLACP